MIRQTNKMFNWGALSRGNTTLRENASIAAGNMLFAAADFMPEGAKSVRGMNLENFYMYKRNCINSQGVSTSQLAGSGSENSVQMQNFNLSEAYNPPIDRLIRTFVDFKKVEYASGVIFDVQPAASKEWVIYKETAPDYTFPKIPEGDRVKLRSGSSDKYYASLDWYGDGAAHNLRAEKDGGFMNFDNQLRALANGAMRKKERLGLAVVQATPVSEDIAWQPPFNPSLANDDPTYLTSRDVQTLVAAVNKIHEDLVDTQVYEENGGNLIILYPFQLWQRMKMMATLAMQPFAESAKYFPDMMNFRWILSNKLVNPDEYYVILPEGELIGQELVPYVNYKEFDPYTLMEGVPAWMSIGFNNGNIKQIKRCKTST